MPSLVPRAPWRRWRVRPRGCSARRAPPPRRSVRRRGTCPDPARDTRPFRRARRCRRRAHQAGGDLRERRLAASIRADERDDLASAELQRGLGENGHAVRVGEVDAVEPAPTSPTTVVRPCSNFVAAGPPGTMAPLSRRDDAIAVRHRPVHPVLADYDGRAPLAREAADEGEQRDRTVGIELRRRFVEDEQCWLERERRGQADTLELASRRARRRSARQGERRRRSREPLARGARSRPGAPRRSRCRSRPRQRAAEHELVVRILEQRGDGPRQLRGSRPPRVASTDFDGAFEPAPVKVRNEARPVLGSTSSCRNRTDRSGARSRPLRSPTTHRTAPGVRLRRT